MLSDFEDRLLAMCEGEPVTIKLAQKILRGWFVRPIKKKQIFQAVCHLSNLQFVQWRYKIKDKLYFSKSLPLSEINSGSVTFQATKTAEIQLAKQREVT